MPEGKWCNLKITAVLLLYFTKRNLNNLSFVYLLDSLFDIIIGSVKYARSNHTLITRFVISLPLSVFYVSTNNFSFPFSLNKPFRSKR